jgi:hypothetical protein
LQKQLLIGLAALVVVLALVTAAIIGRDSIMGAFKPKDEVPTIMIVSRALLQESAASAANIQQMAAADQEHAQAQAQAKAGTAKPAGKDAAPAPAAPSPNDPRSAAQQQGQSMQMLMRVVEDSLGGKMSQAFQDSGRFQVIPQAKVVDAMDAYAKSKHVTPASLMDAFSASVHTESANAAKASAAANQSDSKASGSLLTHGLVEVADKAHAQYTLVVTTGEPYFTHEIEPASADHPAAFVLMAQPEVNVEIFETDGRMAYRFSKQLARPVRVDVALDQDVPAAGTILAQYYTFDDKLSQAISAEVLSWALDKLAPARVMRTGDTVIVNRGTNDGMKNGAVYQVVRESKDTIREGDNGPDLGRERDPVGSIVIDRPQDRISTAKLVSGGPFLKGDIVLVLPAAKASGGGGGDAAVTGSGDTPLGAQAMAQADAAKAGGATHLANVAVDHITAVVGGREVDSTEFAEALSAALAADPRIRILPRAELSKLRSERALNARSSGDVSGSPDEGLRQSSYLVDGRLGVSSSRHDNVVSAGGQSLVTSSTTTTSSSGTLRALAMDGSLVTSVEFSGGGSIQASANAAAHALLLKLFPMKVVQVSGPGTIVVDRGQDAGLKKGGRLQLYHLGAPIVNKQTGAILAEGARTPIGTATITDVQDHIATATVAGGVTVAEGDSAEAFSGGTAPAASPGAPAPRKTAKAAQPTAPAAGEGIHF